MNKTKEYLYYGIGEHKDVFEARGDVNDLLSGCVNMSVKIIEDSGADIGEFVVQLILAWSERNE